MDQSTIIKVLASQYKAGLNMLRDTIEAVPAPLWDAPEFENRTWRLVYHTLWSVHFYLGPSDDAYVPWEKAIKGAESLGASWDDPADKVVEGVHTPEEMLLFLDELAASLEEKISALPLNAPSGFEWYPYTRFELHINTIRHVQHHTAQIIERLREQGIKGIAWAVDGNPPAKWE